MGYDTVIGLEVHVQLGTSTKAFCGCANVFASPPNTNICPVCLGLPGALPVLNAAVLKSALKAALAFQCSVNHFIKFDRKNYFYPDLPKNFQISQYDLPLSEHGFLDIHEGGSQKRIRIKRIHLEEDAGKLIHPEAGAHSLVDYNRSGTPLLEIVSEPDLSSPAQAYAYLSDLKLTLEYLAISDCDMEKGSLRCDANISLKACGASALGVKAELKNMNSFKAVKAGLEYEIRRQTKLLDGSERVIQETRLWDERLQQTFSMRSKEEAHDYRYFPEPDLPPFVFTQDEIEDIRRHLPELPQERLKRFIKSFGLTEKDAAILISNQELAEFFEQSLALLNEPKKVANWLIGPVLCETNTRNLSFAGLGLSPAGLVQLIAMVEDGAISRLVAKDVLSEMVTSRRQAQDIVKEKNLFQVSGALELEAVIDQAIAENKKSVDDYLSGKENALMFLVGQVMKRSSGRANPKAAKEAIIRRLKNV